MAKIMAVIDRIDATAILTPRAIVTDRGPTGAARAHFRATARAIDVKHAFLSGGAIIQSLSVATVAVARRHANRRVARIEVAAIARGAGFLHGITLAGAVAVQAVQRAAVVTAAATGACGRSADVVAGVCAAVAGAQIPGGAVVC